MRKRYVFIGFASFLIIMAAGGWVFMKLADRPAAIKDSLTASHLDKESRTDDGFYLYTSKKNGYSMLFPEEYAIEGLTFQEKKDLNRGICRLKKIRKRHCSALSKFYTPTAIVLLKPILNGTAL
ncbi:hypothetical protein [Rossellomorea marisflavi]|uniref:hypothetical protein n=1 Tax=Rossellomorea marisflavi TaxID=189381 RepID=UPI003D2EF1E1